MIDLTMYIATSDVFCSNIQFSENEVQISFLENRKQQVGLGTMEVLMVDVTANERWKETYVAIQETLVDLIDDILVYRRTEGKPVHAAEIMSPSERMADSKAQARARATLLGEEEPTSPDAR